jgi:uncharacterized protein
MLRQKLQEDQIHALKSGEKQKLEVLRYILAQIKNKEIDTRTELNDEEVVSLIRKQVKEMKESIDAFQKGGRNDLAADTQAKLDIAAVYLPAEMSDEDLKKEIENIIAANQEMYQKNPKTIIGICMKELRGKVDPARIMPILNSVLSS